MTEKLVTIILLNWNGYDDTLEALESLYQIDYPCYNVIVVDNHSTNDSIDKITEYTKGNIHVQTEYTKYCENKPIELTYLREDELKKVDYTSTLLSECSYPECMCHSDRFQPSFHVHMPASMS